MFNPEHLLEALYLPSPETERLAKLARDGLKRVELARKWLPEIVYRLACEVLRIQLQRGVSYLDLGDVIRVAADKRMKDVWKLFFLPGLDPDNARKYFSLSIEASKWWQRDNSVVADKWRLEEIADLCGRLITLLEELPFPLIAPKVAEQWTAFRGCGDEAALTANQKLRMVIAWRLGLFLDKPEFAGVDPFSLADSLRAVRDHCYRELAMHRQRLPRKINQSSARRTYVIRHLAEFMTQVFGKVYYKGASSSVS